MTSVKSLGYTLAISQLIRDSSHIWGQLIASMCFIAVFCDSPAKCIELLCFTVARQKPCIVIFQKSMPYFANSVTRPEVTEIADLQA